MLTGRVCAFENARFLELRPKPYERVAVHANIADMKRIGVHPEVARGSFLTSSSEWAIQNSNL